MITNLRFKVIPLVLILMSMQVSLFAKDINIDSLAKSLSPKKHLLIFIHTTDCGYCESMIEFTFDNEENKKCIKSDFIFVDINVKHDGTISYKDFHGSKKAFAIYMGRNIYPSTIFIDQNSQKVFAQSGYEEEKNYGNILNFITSKSYKNETLTSYLKESSHE